MANINPALNEVQLQQLLHEYEPIISCKLHSSSSRIINATVTFASEYPIPHIELHSNVCWQSTNLMNN